MAEAISTRAQKSLVEFLVDAAAAAHKLDLQAHFGHGLNYSNAHWLQVVNHAEEANIGHAIVARAVFVGLKEAVSDMKRLLNDPAHRPY